MRAKSSSEYYRHGCAIPTVYRHFLKKMASGLKEPSQAKPSLWCKLFIKFDNNMMAVVGKRMYNILPWLKYGLISYFPFNAHTSHIIGCCVSTSNKNWLYLFFVELLFLWIVPTFLFHTNMVYVWSTGHIFYT